MAGRSDWHAIEGAQALAELASSRGGLSPSEAKERLEMHGPNLLPPPPRRGPLARFLAQFHNVLIYVLIASAAITAALGEWVDAGVIAGVIVINAIVGFIQEGKAEEALDAIRKMLSLSALVLRGGAQLRLPAEQLVPGDVVILEAGNYVPADVRLLEAINLRVEEAALTGESVPVAKDASANLEKDIPLGDRKNTAFMGTLVNYGRGRGVVVNTGMHTQIGMIAEMLQAVQQEPTPLQRRLDQLGKTLGWAALAVCGLVFIVGWLRGFNPLQMFLIAVSLAIAAVPEGLPAVVTISLALGMREMIKRHALIRRLSSVETLGSATVICSDKTGTLTQNVMTVTRMWVDGKFIEVTGSGYDPNGEFRLDEKPVNLMDYPAALTNLWVTTLNNDAQLEVSGASDMRQTYRTVGDPTEGALIVAASLLSGKLEETTDA